MAVVVLLILVIAWVIVLAPPLLRSRGEIRRTDSIGNFHHSLGVLGRTQGLDGRSSMPAGVRADGPLTPPLAARMGTASMSPTTASQRSARRRREVFTVLGAAATLTLLAALTVGGAMWGLHLLADLLLGAYAALVAWFRQLSIEHQQKVRYLPAARGHAPAPLAALRRTASS